MESSKRHASHGEHAPPAATPTAAPAAGNPGDSGSFSKVVLIAATLVGTVVAAKYGGQLAGLVSRVAVTVMIVAIGVFFALQIYSMNEQSAKELVANITKGAFNVGLSILRIIQNFLPPVSGAGGQ
ncbi:hypothetical protein K0U07_03495 [bacterium]|nr:hypothetical protein [bacterium]